MKLSFRIFCKFVQHDNLLLTLFDLETTKNHRVAMAVVWMNEVGGCMFTIYITGEITGFVGFMAVKSF